MSNRFVLVPILKCLNVFVILLLIMSIIKSCIYWSWNIDWGYSYLDVIIQAFNLRKLLLKNRLFGFFLHFYFFNLKWKSTPTSKKYKHMHTKKLNSYAIYLFTIYSQWSLIFGSIKTSESNKDSETTQLMWPIPIVHWAKVRI